MADDWASAKAAEMMAQILDPGITLDVFELILAHELRLAEATATERTFRECRERRAA